VRDQAERVERARGLGTRAERFEDERVVRHGRIPRASPRTS
jgi:hypothetical protein